MPTLYQVVVVALLATFVILFLEKTGLKDKMTDYFDVKLPIIGEMLRCDFCLSFWTAMTLSVIALIITLDVSLLCIPLLSTPITRYLL
nr:MAG: Protein of unknown function (DUF1360) [Bacteriophage sp.]